MKAHDLPDGDAVVPTAQGYDRWAEVYDGDGNPLTALEEPVVAELLGDVRGLRVADIGCGTGRHAIVLARAGAEVTGVDFSSGMIAKAREKPGAENITFIAHDIRTRLPLEDGSFDRAICCLVLEHIEDIDHLMGELRRICRAGSAGTPRTPGSAGTPRTPGSAGTPRTPGSAGTPRTPGSAGPPRTPGGTAVVTAMHPAMMLIGRQACFRDPATGEKIHPRSYKSQISDYVMAALRAGWRIDHLSEHAVDEALARSLPRAEKYLGWLMLFAMRLVA